MRFIKAFCGKRLTYHDTLAFLVNKWFYLQFVGWGRNLASSLRVHSVLHTWENGNTFMLLPLQTSSADEPPPSSATSSPSPTTTTTTRSTTTLGPGERKINPLFLKGLSGEVFLRDDDNRRSEDGDVDDDVIVLRRFPPFRVGMTIPSSS